MRFTRHRALRGVAWGAALTLALSACRTGPRRVEEPPPAPPVTTAAEPVESVPSWVGEPLSWHKLEEISTWLATHQESSGSYWHIEAELQLNLGRLEFATREPDKDPATKTRLRAARTGLSNVVAQTQASPTQRKRAQDALAKADRLLGARPTAKRTGFDLVSRAEWGAAPAHPEHMEKNVGGWKRITVHHSAEREPPRLDGTVAASAAAVRSIQKAHVDGKDTHYSDIGYHFVIDPYGKVFEGRDMKYQGAHAYGDNNVQNVGVCLIGNFEEERPAQAALASLRTLLEKLRNENKISRRNVFTHKDLKNTECPGRFLAPWVERYKREP
ncbi:MAG: peptidoglycan recognition family protein [Planctomycetota bacterium]